MEPGLVPYPSSNSVLEEDLPHSKEAIYQRCMESKQFRFYWNTEKRIKTPGGAQI
jgi:hypothetical protein